MRGLGGAFTQLLVNGEPAPPGFNVEQISPAQVERVEVSKAPTADQSAQAIAGTVNIILKDAPRVVQKDLRLGLAFNDDKPVLNTGFTYGDRKGGLGFVLPVSTWQWRLRNETSNERVGSDALGRSQRLRSEGFDVPWGYGGNIAPRLNLKISDDETLTLQGFYVVNNFRNRGETDGAVTPDTLDQQRRRTASPTGASSALGAPTSSTTTASPMTAASSCAPALAVAAPSSTPDSTVSAAPRSPPPRATRSSSCRVARSSA